MKCKRDSDGRKLDHQSLQTMRMQAVAAVRRGQPVADVAAAFGMNERTVYRWLAAFAEGGHNGLPAFPPRPSQFPAAHRSSRTSICAGSPARCATPPRSSIGLSLRCGPCA